ncbi:MAG: hypothetical protein GWP12_01250 [Nitrospirae bacterium]|nr:hypothetical protein [Nitrospirota bacterium]
MNKGVLISINDKILNDDWIKNLRKGISQIYDTKKILNAYESMPVYYYIKNEGIKYRGTVMNSNDGYPELNI